MIVFSFFMEIGVVMLDCQLEKEELDLSKSYPSNISYWLSNRAYDRRKAENRKCIFRQGYIWNKIIQKGGTFIKGCIFINCIQFIEQSKIEKVNPKQFIISNNDYHSNIHFISSCFFITIFSLNILNYITTMFTWILYKKK